MARRAKGRERVADRFAAELLMPGFMFRPRIRPATRITCELLRQLAGEFRVSLHAVARRCAEIDTHPVMVVLTDQHRSSRPLARSRDVSEKLWPHTKLERETMASQCLDGVPSLRGDLVPAEAWFDIEFNQTCFVHEDSMQYGGGVMSILSIEDQRLLNE